MSSTKEREAEAKLCQMSKALEDMNEALTQSRKAFDDYQYQERDHLALTLLSAKLSAGNAFPTNDRAIESSFDLADDFIKFRQRYREEEAKHG